MEFRPVQLIATALALLVALSLRPPGETDPFEVQRQKMVETQILQRGVEDPKLLSVIGKVQRHLFLPHEVQLRAYDDTALPIGYGQTISQPFIQARMISLLGLSKRDRVLELGTGTGYLTAVMAELAGEVFSIEIIEPLARKAEKTLAKLGYRNVQLVVRDGHDGWPEEAPFDAIILTFAVSEIPKPLFEQLEVGGRLVAPVGEYVQDLRIVTRTQGGLKTEKVAPVHFVPIVRERRQPREENK